MLRAGQQEVVHGGQQQQGAALGERGTVEERQHVAVVGDAAADGGVGPAPVVLHDGGETTEVVGQRELDQHGA